MMDMVFKSAKNEVVCALFNVIAVR